VARGELVRRRERAGEILLDLRIVGARVEMRQSQRTPAAGPPVLAASVMRSSSVGSAEHITLAQACTFRAMHPRVVLHADMDAFYASIEQRDPPGAARPAGGGGRRRATRRGVGGELRGAPVRSALGDVFRRGAAALPELVFVRGSMRRYAAESKRIFEIFERFTPVVQGLSLDEAFLDLTARSGCGGRRAASASACAAPCARRRSSRCRSGSRR
jgi:hypothetical protein